MADAKITELTEATEAVDEDLVAIVTDVSTTPVTQKILISNLNLGATWLEVQVFS